MNLNIRQAVPEDIDFLIDMIIEAEKSGSEIISYCAIFSITEAELRQYLRQILEEDVRGQELCVAHFMVAEVDGELAGALSAFVEMEGGLPSNIIKTNLFMYLLGREKMMEAEPNLRLMHKIHMPRSERGLQIECGTVVEKYRGKGILRELLDRQIKFKQEQGPPFDKVQLILLGNNESARKSHVKAGYTLIHEVVTDDEAIWNLVPGNSKILMEKINN